MTATSGTPRPKRQRHLRSLRLLRLAAKPTLPILLTNGELEEKREAGGEEEDFVGRQAAIRDPVEEDIAISLCLPARNVSLLFHTGRCRCEARGEFSVEYFQQHASTIRS